MSNEDVKNCIIKFDKNLSLKVNKSQILSFESDLRKKFLGIEVMGII